MKTIYLANPFGFSELSKSKVLPPIIKKLESLGLEVWEPFSRNDQPDFSKSDWAYNIAQKDYKDVRETDAIFAVCNGTPPDEGVMVELGIAIALNKKIFLFRDDFRTCSDSECYPLNLMLFTGFPKIGWEKYYYRSVKEITDKTKALYTWAQNGS